MADPIQMGTYRLVALTAGTRNPDLYGVVPSGRIAMLYSDAPRFQMSTYRIVALMAATRNPDLKGVVPVMRMSLLYGDAAKFLMSTFRVVSLMAPTRNPDFTGLITAGRLSFLIQPMTGAVRSMREAFLIDQKPVGPPVYLPLLRNEVTQAQPVRPLSQVISYETVKQVYTASTSKVTDYTFPWSITRVAGVRILFTQRRLISVISYTRVAQMRVLASSAANFNPVDEVISTSRAAQLMQLTVQSIDIPYQPTSGVYARQARVLFTQSSPLPMWTSPAYVMQQVVKVAQRRPAARLPISYTRVPELTTQVVQRAPAAVLPQGIQFTAQVMSQAVTPTEMPVPVGVIHAAEMRQLTAAARIEALPLSNTQVTQLTTFVLHSSPISTQSRTRAAQARQLVLQHADYPSPGSMTAKERAAQVRLQTTMKADYPGAVIWSQTRVPQMRITYSQRALASWYPDPDSMANASKNVFVPQFMQHVAFAHALSWPISQTPVPQLALKVLAGLPVDSLESIANRGMFVTLAAQQLATVATYPTTENPVSRLTIDLLQEQVATVAEYDDPHLQSYLIIDQIAETVAATENYPDPSQLASPITVSLLTEQIAAESVYPDAGDLHSPVVLSQLAEQLSVRAGYPDKDIPQSMAEVSQLTQQAAFKAAYPSKDSPQSILRVNLVRQQVARRDQTMYQMPTPPRRHRVRIVCRIVY